MLDINLKQLEAFVATAEYCSFTRAAEAMYLTQSTVSSHIGALERVLGVRLIRRGARQRVTLTEEGNQVYREAKDILNRCQALQDLGSHDSRNQLTIGASTVPGQYLLPEIMAAFLEQYPNSRYVQLRGDSLQIHRYLEQGKARLGFVGTAADWKQYHYHPVAEDRLVVITANQEPYCTLHAQGISGRELLERPILLREETSGTRQAFAAYLSGKGIPWESLDVVAQIDNPEAIKSSVSRGMGISVMSNLAVREDLKSGKLLSFDLDTEGTFRKIYLAWRKDAMLAPMEQKFISFIAGRTAMTGNNDRKNR